MWPKSGLAAAIREIAEELGADLDVADLLVLDLAPHPAESDKLLVIFGGRTLDQADLDQMQLDTTEIAEARFFPVEQLAELMPDRLARRVAEAPRLHATTYLEHGRSLAAAARP
jgi:8-oxo-dGTP diphosphatase